MLDLENFDLELDEDVPAGPLNKSDLIDSTSLPWSQTRSKENTVRNSCLPAKNNLSELLLADRKTLDSPKTNQEKRNVVNYDTGDDMGFCNIFNAPIKKQNEPVFGKDAVNDSNKYSAKRILTHRKFPGPAGLLPDKSLKDLSHINLVIDNSSEKLSSEVVKESVILCSQTSPVFTEASYKKLISDFDMGKENCPLNKYKIDWIKKRAVKKTLYYKKIPFLAVVLHNVDHSTPDPVLTLRDSTGEIYGTLHRDAWADLGAKLCPGAALALKQVGVLITGMARRQIHLNITTNNIINIYCYSDDEEVETNFVNQLDKGEILRIITEYESATPNIEPKSPAKLFSTICDKKLNCFVKTAPLVTRNNATANAENKNRVQNKTNQENNNTSFCNGINFMEDDFNDFMASLDENSLTGLTSTQNEETKIDESTLTRKRKMDFEQDSSSSEKLYCKRPEESMLKSLAPSETRREKYLLGSHPLSQAETQILEEVLDGINFDDFDY